MHAIQFKRLVIPLTAFREHFGHPDVDESHEAFADYFRQWVRTAFFAEQIFAVVTARTSTTVEVAGIFSVAEEDENAVAI